MRLQFFLPLLFLAACSSNKPLSTVDQVDLAKYAGNWYEIERLPNSFEEGLFCVQATYILNADGSSILVENSGYGEDGWERIKGKAIRRDASKPGEIKVSFFWPFYGDYFVMELGDDYEYALVGSPTRNYLWILSRTETLDESIVSDLKQKAEAAGFDTSSMIRVSHDCPSEEERL